MYAGSIDGLRNKKSIGRRMRMVGLFAALVEYMYRYLCLSYGVLSLLRVRRFSQRRP